MVKLGTLLTVIGKTDTMIVLTLKHTLELLENKNVGIGLTI
jgi:hypothetical protein